MILFEAVCILNKRIKLTEERWNHVVSIHPEVKEYPLEKIKEGLVKPDLVVQSRNDPKVFLYHSKTGSYYLTIVAKHENSKGFILTAYVGTTVKRGDVVWKRKN